MLILAVGRRRLAEGSVAHFKVREYVNLCYIFPPGPGLVARCTREFLRLVTIMIGTRRLGWYGIAETHGPRP